MFPSFQKVDVDAKWMYDNMYAISVRWEKKQRIFGVRKCVETTNYTYRALRNICNKDYDMQDCGQKSA